jgi:hypothetical protein
MHMLTKLGILVKARFANACPTVCFVRMLKKEKAVIHSSTPHSQASSILLTNPTNHNKVCHLYRLFFSRELHLFRRYSIQLNTRAPCQTFKRNQIVHIRRLDKELLAICNRNVRPQNRAFDTAARRILFRTVYLKFNLTSFERLSKIAKSYIWSDLLRFRIIVQALVAGFYLSRPSSDS